MGVHDVADVSEQQISELMVGGSVRLKVEKTPAVPGETVAEFAAVTLPGKGGKPVLDDVSLAVRAGEILCLAGVEGNGQQEVVDLITGTKGGWGYVFERSAVLCIQQSGKCRKPLTNICW